jgi:hypothetical protein
MDIALAADDFIRQGTYFRNWSLRTVATCAQLAPNRGSA